MTFNGLEKSFFGHVLVGGDGGVEGVKFKMIVVSTGWWAGSFVLILLGRVETNSGVGRERIGGDYGGGRIDIENEPVNPISHGSVRVIDEQSETLGIGGDVGDGKRRIDVFTLAGVLAGN